MRGNHMNPCGPIAAGLAVVIRLIDRVERLERSVSDMALAFREDSKARDKDYLDHDRRIQKMENLVEFVEKFQARKRLDSPADT